MPAHAPAPPDASIDAFSLADRFRQERDEAIRERDVLRAGLLALERERQVVRIAGTLGFVDPQDGWAHLKGGSLSEDDWSSPAEIRGALERVLRERPYLKQGSQGHAGSAGARRLTVEQVRAMSADEINRRWDEVRRALEHP